MLPEEIIRKIMLYLEPTDVVKELNIYIKFLIALNATNDIDNIPWTLFDVCEYRDNISVLQSMLPPGYVV